MIERAAIDISVALKWALDDEDGIAPALALRDEMAVHHRLRLFAPRLFAYEAVNALVMAARRGRIETKDALDAARDLFDVGVELVDPPMERVAAIAAAGGFTAYDAAYVVVAEQHGGVLWTDDGPVLRCLSQDAARIRLGSAVWGFEVPAAKKISGFLPG